MSRYKMKATIWKKDEEGKLVKAGITRFPSYGSYLYHHTHTKEVNGEIRRIKPKPAIKVVGADGSVAYKPKEHVHGTH